ncbi:alpha/beta fold hydrolase [Nocardia altamirensis]|uniref:alpha/beta fold hydrolase n=1 Tax=Nocardia altamirensis TaxID=472158 RepID=UPI0008403839|nr:alpha/beta hydrolase [Nocardia altamirensis]
MSSNERIFEVNGIRLCTETFGESGGTPVLFLHGAGESMLAWDAEFIGRLVADGWQAIRIDSRDAGRSSTFPVGAPGYGLTDMVADTIGLLDALEAPRAHLIAMSQGSAVSQLTAIHHPDRVASLTLTASTPGGPGHESPDLPGISAELSAFFTNEPPVPDWADRAAVIEYLVEAERPFAASSYPFDAEHRAEAAGLVFDRAADIAAQLTNPYLVDAGEPWRDLLGTITAPTLVLHGAEDPLFPIEHGKALAAAIPGAGFLPMAQAGHEVPPPHQWDDVIPAILAHLARVA